MSLLSFTCTLYVNVHTCSNGTVTCIQHKMYVGERDVQKVLYTAQNVRWGASCAKSALYSTKCTLGSEMCKKCSMHHKMYAGERDVQKVLYAAQNVHVCWRERCAKNALYSTKCTLESEMCKKCSMQHKMYMYAGGRDVQKVLYTAQNVRWGASCAKSALYSTKCTLESEMCKKCSMQHKMYMYAGGRDVQKMLYTAQNVHWEREMCKAIHHKM